MEVSVKIEEEKPNEAVPHGRGKQVILPILEPPVPCPQGPNYPVPYTWKRINGEIGQRDAHAAQRRLISTGVAAARDQQWASNMGSAVVRPCMDDKCGCSHQFVFEPEGNLPSAAQLEAYELDPLSKIRYFRDKCPPLRFAPPYANQKRGPFITVDGPFEDTTNNLGRKLSWYLHHKGGYNVGEVVYLNTLRTDKAFVDYQRTIHEFRQIVVPSMMCSVRGQTTSDRPMPRNNRTSSLRYERSSSNGGRETMPIFMSVGAQFSAIETYHRLRTNEYATGIIHHRFRDNEHSIVKTRPSLNWFWDQVRPDKHWRYMLDQWYGIPGPDLMIYIDCAFVLQEGECRYYPELMCIVFGVGANGDISRITPQHMERLWLEIKMRIEIAGFGRIQPGS